MLLRTSGLTETTLQWVKESRRLTQTSSSLCKCSVKSILSQTLTVLSICEEAPSLASKRSRVAESECTCKHVHLGLDSLCRTEYTGRGHGQPAK